MEDPASTPSINNADSSPQSQQDLKGDGNQAIVEMNGGTAINKIDGNVIYNYYYYYREEVKTAIDDAAKSATADLLPCPYRGLYHFGPEDAEYFFGRESFVEELVKATQTSSFIPLLGASGSGKSSVVLAGLVPKLQQAGHWQITYFRPSAGVDPLSIKVDPFHSLALALVPLYAPELNKTERMRQSRQLASHFRTGETLLADVFLTIEQNYPTDRVLLIVDQFEELYTLCNDEDTRRSFLDLLLAGVAVSANRTSAPVLVATMRADFLGNALSYPPFADVLQNRLKLLGPMNRAELTKAIAEPAKLARHPLDLSTIDLLIEQTADREGALPLLQFALERIWAGIIEKKEPAETLRTIGGVGGALAGEAQRIYASLTSEEQGIARRVFLGLVQLGEGAKDTRRRIELERLVSHRDSLEQVKEVIDKFANRDTRLITLSKEGGAETAEVTHEALFDNWQQLKEWLDGGRSDLRFQRRLDDAVVIWQENGRPEGSLWRSPDLDLLRRYQERAGDDLTPFQLEFFQAADRSERKAKHFQKFVKRFIQASLAFTTNTVILIATVFVLKSRQDRSQQLEILGTNAANLLAFNQPVNSTINAIAAKNSSESAWLKFPDPDRAQAALVDGILLDTVWVANPEQNQLPHDSTVISAAYSPDGQRIVSSGHDKAVRIWDAKTGVSIGQPLLLKGHKNYLTSIAVSPDGQQLVTGSKDGTIGIWDAQTGAPIGKLLQGHHGEVKAVAYSPNGQRIISGSDDSTVRIWDAKTGVSIGQPLQTSVGQIGSIAYSPDGRIVSINADKTVQSWDVSGASLLKTACDRLRYHSSLNDPKTDVAREAKQTCEQYVWKK